MAQLATCPVEIGDPDVLVTVSVRLKRDSHVPVGGIERPVRIVFSFIGIRSGFEGRSVRVCRAEAGEPAGSLFPLRFDMKGCTAEPSSILKSSSSAPCWVSSFRYFHSASMT